MAWVNIPTLTDWQYDEDTKKIRHNTGSSRSHVNTLYSAIMDLVDDASFMDSGVPMRALTPTEYEIGTDARGVATGWTMNADSDFGYLYGGSIKITSPDDLWANFYNLGTLAASTPVYIEQNQSLVSSPPGYTTGDIDVLVKVRAAGSDTNSRKVSLFARKLGDRYDNFEIQAPTTGGRNPVPLSTENDINDDSSGGSVAGVVIAFGTASKDIGDGTGSHNYDVVIDGGGNSVIDVYRRLKYLTREQNTSAIDSPENTTEGRFYISAVGGYTQIKSAPFGSFAGGKFFGARGVWLENVSDSNNMVLIDAAGDTHTPPTTIAITVSSVAVGDNVLVARDDGFGAIDKSQFTLNGVHSSTSTVTVNEALTADIPDAGALRLGDSQFTYTGINRPSKQFTGVSPALSGANLDPLYQPYIDATVPSGTSLTKSFIYYADFDIIVRVRQKGILPYENTATVTNAGASVGAIRTTDTIVT